jgi:hypothetical protein
LHNTLVGYKKRKYKGREIEYNISTMGQENATGEMDLKIDEKHVHIIRTEDGLFVTHLLPFQTYNSIDELFKDVIDKVPAFRKEESSR